MKRRIKYVFISGGLGFIGSNIVSDLYKQGKIIKVFDNVSSGSKKNLLRLGVPLESTRVKIIRGDILDIKSLEKEMKGSDIVYHKAAQLEITKAVSDPYFDLKSNTIGTLNILESMRKNSIRNLVNASSACIYGQKSDKDLPTAEDSSTVPNWAYGVSKLAAEKYCNIYSTLYGFNIVSTRYSIVYGQNEWYGRVMPIYIKRSMNGDDLLLFDSGKQKRDFVHVDDVVSFNSLAMSHLSSNQDGFHIPINISTGVGVSIKELARLVQKNAKSLYDNKVSIKFDTVKEGSRSKLMDRVRLPSELKNMVLSNINAKKVFNWSPKINIQSGLLKQMTWAKTNGDMWKKMSY
jgi:UDP-glucose 4-epimerase